MPLVQSFGQLQALHTPGFQWAHTSGAVNLYDQSLTYAELYRRQPNVRTCVDFLARNIAQLSVHAFRRVSDTDRVRLAGHDVERWLSKPNPYTTRYRLVESLIGDLGIYYNAYWLKVPYLDARGRGSLGFVRLPPSQMSVEGGILPTHFCWTRDGKKQEYPLDAIVYFNGYNPCHDLMGLSPLETLRRTLAEEAAAGEHREAYWRNASRHEGVIERPANAGKWQQAQKQEFRRQWQERFAGGAGSGLVAVLEDGMTFKATSFSPKDSEYLSARKLTREECASAYHIPLPMVGILEHATFSNIKEQHKHLYADTLGPWLEMIVSELERQALPESNDANDVYLEFNIAAKLAGSFEEQANAIRTMVGRPVMTANEGRARLNLPASTDPTADQLAAQQGGPSDASANPERVPAPRERTDADEDDDADDDAEAIATVTLRARERQRARVNKLPPTERVAAFDRYRPRWTRELADDLTPHMGLAAWTAAEQETAATRAELVRESTQ